MEKWDAASHRSFSSIDHAFEYNISPVGKTLLVRRQSSYRDLTGIFENPYILFSGLVNTFHAIRKLKKMLVIVLPHEKLQVALNGDRDNGDPIGISTPMHKVLRNPTIIRQLRINDNYNIPSR